MVPMWVLGFEKAYAHRHQNVSRDKKWCLEYDRSQWRLIFFSPGEKYYLDS